MTLVAFNCADRLISTARIGFLLLRGRRRLRASPDQNHDNRLKSAVCTFILKSALPAAGGGISGPLGESLACRWLPCRYCFGNRAAYRTFRRLHHSKDIAETSPSAYQKKSTSAKAAEAVLGSGAEL